jgi:exosortase E/protease (VPEID-CTERM system)
LAPPKTDPHAPFPGRQVSWIAVVTLVLLEAILLATQFNIGTLLVSGDWWTQVFKTFWLGSTTILALLIVGVALIRTEVRQKTEGLGRLPAGPFYLGHLVAFLGFALVTMWASEANLRGLWRADIWAGLWAMLGLMSLLCLLAAVLPGFGFRGLVMVSLAGIAAFAGGMVTYEYWPALSHSTFWVVQGLLRLVFGEVVSNPDQLTIGVPPFGVKIERSCSGFEGMGQMLVFLSLYFWIYRKDLRFPRPFLLLPIGVVLVWLGNAVRIAVLVCVGVWISPKVAENGFHSHAGWLLFNGIALGLMAVTRYSRFFARTPETAEPAEKIEDSNPTVVYLAPLFALVAATMLTGAFLSGFDWAYPVRVLVVAGVLWHFRHTYAGWGWSWSWGAVAVGAGVFAVWLALEPLHPVSGESEFSFALKSLPAGWAAAWLAFRVFGSVVTGPLAEELAFRGYLTRRLMDADFEKVPLGRFSWPSLLVSSALFGVLHGRWLAGFLAGLAYAWVLSRRGRLSDAVLAHAVTNALIAGYVLATGSWSLWL